jgi:hypothetical protein
VIGRHAAPDADELVKTASAYAVAVAERIGSWSGYDTHTPARVEGLVRLGCQPTPSRLHCDLREAPHTKRYFDVAGHYSRADLLNPTAVAQPTP